MSYFQKPACLLPFKPLNSKTTRSICTAVHYPKNIFPYFVFYIACADLEVRQSNTEESVLYFRKGNIIYSELPR